MSQSIGPASNKYKRKCSYIQKARAIGGIATLAIAGMTVTADDTEFQKKWERNRRACDNKEGEVNEEEAT